MAFFDPILRRGITLLPYCDDLMGGLLDCCLSGGLRPPVKMKLEVTERKLRDAERLTSAAEERADRAESTATETNVENELATSLGIRVYELERDKDKLEATIRDAAADRDLFKTQAEAALRERSQVLDRIKVEQQRNDELVFPHY